MGTLGMWYFVVYTECYHLVFRRTRDTGDKTDENSEHSDGDGEPVDGNRYRGVGKGKGEKRTLDLRRKLNYNNSHNI